jgi:hypothetical protein
VQELLPAGSLFAINKTFPIVPTSNAVRSLTHVSPCGAPSCWPKPARRLSQRAKRHAQRQQAEGLAQTAACFHGAIVGTVSSVYGRGARRAARRTGDYAPNRWADINGSSGRRPAYKWKHRKRQMGTR